MIKPNIDKNTVVFENQQNTEIWKPIEGFDGYEISNFGKVRSYLTFGGNKTSKPHILKQWLNIDGYSISGLSRNRKNSYPRVHRLIAQTFIPNPENKPEINHKNGIKNDNRIENLEWVTTKENAIHRVNVLGLQRGEKHGNSKLKEKEIIEIRRLYKETNLTQKEIGKIFGVTYQNISQIINRKLWKHIP